LALVSCLATPAHGLAEEALLASLRPGHPRLLADEQTWAEVTERGRADPRLAGLLRIITSDARRLLDEPALAYRKIGRRLLAVSRTALQRTLTLSLAYRLTGEEAFARRAEAEMRSVAAFPDWNPSHFLDVAEMTAALAFGYDWLHDALGPEARATIRQAIVEKGLRPGLDPAAPHNGWQSRENNWNQVCFGGLTLGALAVAEEETSLARQVLARARAGIVHGLKPYAPDGVYPEGPGYWSYGTSYQVLMIAALQSALATDWDLSASPGFLESATVLLQTTGPTGLLFNFADGREQGGLQPALFWFARRLRDPFLLLAQERALDTLLQQAKAGRAADTSRLLPLVAIWWPEGKAAATYPRRFWMGRGPNPIAVFRGSWTDPRALYLALKGGSADLNHAHMDAGSFVLEADGVRWARDLGMQDYESLESKGIDLWNRRQDSQRWQVFRLNNHSHNTLTIGGQLHRVDGAARIVAFSDADASPFAVVDLSSVFAGQARSVLRGFRLLGDRTVLVQDELKGLTPGASVRWAMVTTAEVVANGARATLRENGRTLVVRLLAPAGRFALVPAEPPRDTFNAPNPGKRILTLTASAPEDGVLRIAVLLTPGAAAMSPHLEPVEEWIKKTGVDGSTAIGEPKIERPRGASLGLIRHMGGGARRSRGQTYSGSSLVDR
jgi:hypothetical protein